MKLFGEGTLTVSDKPFFCCGSICKVCAGVTSFVTSATRACAVAVGTGEGVGIRMGVPARSGVAERVRTTLMLWCTGVALALSGRCTMRRVGGAVEGRTTAVGRTTVCAVLSCRSDDSAAGMTNL